MAAIGGPASVIRTTLQTCSFFGVPGSVPSSIGDSALPDQAAPVLKALQPRSIQASSVNIPTASQADILTVVGSVFGANFTILPHFTPPDATNLQSAFAQIHLSRCIRPDCPITLAQPTYSHSPGHLPA